MVETIPRSFPTWSCDDKVLVLPGDVLCEKKDAMEPFPSLACRLLKHTLMRVRWNAAWVSTIFRKSFTANWTR